MLKLYKIYKLKKMNYNKKQNKTKKNLMINGVNKKLNINNILMN